MTSAAEREDAAEEAAVRAGRDAEWNAPADDDLPPDWTPAKPPPSRWSEDGTCTYCGHDRDNHKTHAEKRPRAGACKYSAPGRLCRCMYVKETA